MRTDLSHLPAAKRRELDYILKVLFEEFEDATRHATQPRRKAGRILKVILFGSHARGDWVADRASGYMSDYDLLIIVNHEELTDVSDYWIKADDRLVREVLVTRRLKAPVNFIVHTLMDVNDQLARGRYFFTDIYHQGIALYEASGVRNLRKPEPLNADMAYREAADYFEAWFKRAQSFYKSVQYALKTSKNNEDLKVAAFLLHQTTEHLYHCTLLVLTLYSPPSHKLNFLRSQCEGRAPRLIAAWPRDDKVSRRRFELLRRAYVEARYSPHYKITADELAWLSERVEDLQSLVKAVCEERLAEMGSGRS